MDQRPQYKTRYMNQKEKKVGKNWHGKRFSLLAQVLRSTINNGTSWNQKALCGENHRLSDKAATYRMGQDFDQLYIQDRANIQNIERTQETKCQETNYFKNEAQI